MRALLGLLLLISASSVALAAETEPAGLKGPYEIWEDVEGGAVCDIAFDPDQAIGGKALELDPACAKVFEFGGEAVAWFIDDQERLVLIDATRKPLARFDRLDDGSYYARRDDKGLQNLNVTPKD